MNKLFFDTWESVLRTFIITILAYIALIILLRISGKRSLSKMNAFDFVVTIALGSAFAAVTLNKDIPLADGITVFVLLIGMQFIITWLAVRYKTVSHLVTNRPAMLLYKGELYENILKQERVTMQEIYSAARKKGIAELKDIDIAILEPTGDILIIPKMDIDDAQTLKDVIHKH
ncbi:DUF421 domain-containing protein [Flavobacterium rhizosphaerae]|uniref:YetF domain-containing protein n=1 Tax=Flavobacterium rhizosphaerae TaxID=3163298 RepID=A0ABW8Z1U9_9FLAO